MLSPGTTHDEQRDGGGTKHLKFEKFEKIDEGRTFMLIDTPGS